MKKLVNFIKLKIEKRELLEYLIWKLGIQKVLRHQVFSHPIRYLMYKKGCQREETLKKIWN